MGMAWESESLTQFVGRNHSEMVLMLVTSCCFPIFVLDKSHCPIEMALAWGQIPKIVDYVRVCTYIYIYRERVMYTDTTVSY